MFHYCRNVCAMIHGGAAAALAVADVASDQWGIVTAAQMLAAGVTRVQLHRLETAGVIDRVHQGVYRLVRFPGSPLDDLRATWIATDRSRHTADRLDGSDPLVVISHSSATAVYAVGDLPADHHHFTATRRMRLSLPDVRMHVDKHLSPQDWTTVDGILVTTPPRTVDDLVRSGIDGDHLGGIIRDLLQRDLAQADDIATALAPHALAYGRPSGAGHQVVVDLLEQAGVSTNVDTLSAAAMSRRTREARIDDTSFRTDGMDIDRLAEQLGAALLRSDRFQEQLRKISRGDVEDRNDDGVRRA